MPEAEKDSVIPSAREARHLTCSICSQLSDREEALEHVQASDDDTHLPEAASRLQVAYEIQPGHPGLLNMSCPECRTYYHFRSVYEFLIGFGSSYNSSRSYLAAAIGGA